jgi:glycerophosphoryl diester phosphodiesterase
MRHPLLSFDRVLAIAHRGGAGVRPENTLAAFDGAVAEDVDAFELDVRLSRDGEVVVIHDATLERTTSAAGAVSACTAEALARVDAAWHFGPDRGFPFRGQGIGIPRLSEVLRRYADVPVVVELKGDSVELAHRTVEVIRQANAIDRVVVAGFAAATMAAVRRCAREMTTSACTPEVRRALFGGYVGISARRRAYQLLSVPERRGMWRVISRGFVRRAIGAGVPVHVWTVNEAEEMQRLIAWGVTGIISDRPSVAVAVARESRPLASVPLQR